jgi:hypothetical protein
MKYAHAEIEILQKRGYQVHELTPYQFRVESILDLYPKRRRYHNITTQERGHYPPAKDLPAFVEAQVKARTEKPAFSRKSQESIDAAAWWTKFTPKEQAR